jgi:cbb3-type cytochrome oxidase cytochrome c subunit
LKLALGLLLGALLAGVSVASSAAPPRPSVVAARWAKREGFSANAQAVAGARLFIQAGCRTCHRYLGTGLTNLGAPDLSREGAKRRGIAFQIRHLRCPSCVAPGSPMPPFGALGALNLRRIAVFLEASKGPKAGR